MVRQIIQCCLLQCVVIYLSVASISNASNSIFSSLDQTTKIIDVCTANIAVLNKQTTIRKVITLKQGETKIVDNLSLSLIKCYLDSDSKSDGVLIEIYENYLDSDPHKLFSGWLIFPDQYLSSLEHSIYEILLIDRTT